MSCYAVKAYAFQFISDGVSLSFSQDLSLIPVAEDFAGSAPQGLTNPMLTNSQSVTMPSYTAAIVGTVVTYTFAAALPQFDVNNNAVLYLANFLVKYLG